MVDLQENTIPVVAQHQYGRLVTARQMTWNDNRTREVVHVTHVIIQETPPTFFPGSRKKLIILHHRDVRTG